jgi:hypothetical protein
MSTSLRLLLDTPYWCHDCVVWVPLAVAPAGDHGYYIGYICSSCLCAVDILGVLATRELAQAREPPDRCRVPSAFAHG